MLKGFDILFQLVPVLGTCQDQVDNDRDAHIDCDDQDCEIYAVCASPESQKKRTTSPPPDPEVTRVTVVESQSAEELGRRCRDRIDNDQNGLTDCQESQCQRSYYCRREMFEYIEDDTRPPGFFGSFALGLAAPNFRHPRATTDSIYGDDISFDPDIGGMIDIQLGFMFLKFVGAGIGYKGAITGAGNHDAGWLNDRGSDDYKFVGMKHWHNIGGFARLQWPFERVVPYVNLHAGMSLARHRWHVYHDDNDWDDIHDYESDDTSYIEGEQDKRKSGTMRHFTFAVEPGFNVFVSKRRFGIGLKAWLPVVANKDSETDNVGVLLDFIFTPQWRGPKTMKEKYKNPPKPVAPAKPAAEPKPVEAEPAEPPSADPTTPVETVPAETAATES